MSLFHTGAAKNFYSFGNDVLLLLSEQSSGCGGVVGEAESLTLSAALLLREEVREASLKAIHLLLLPLDSGLLAVQTSILYVCGEKACLVGQCGRSRQFSHGARWHRFGEVPDHLHAARSQPLLWDHSCTVLAIAAGASRG